MDEIIIRIFKFQSVFALEVWFSIFCQKSFNFISAWSEIMRFKSDQLELGFSLHVLTLFVTFPSVSWVRCGT